MIIIYGLQFILYRPTVPPIMEAANVRTGPLVPILVRLSLPILAGQVFNLLYSVVDTYFVARIDLADPWLVGATGLVFPLFFTFFSLNLGLTGGVSSLVARAIGAGKADELDSCAETGLTLALGVSAAVVVAVYLAAEPLLKLLGGSGKLLEYGLDYLYWLLPTLPFMLLGAVFVGILQAEGRTRHMMVSMIIGTVANIVLDPVLIFAAGMGIAGAGLATSIGYAATLLYLVAVFLMEKSAVRIHWRFSAISLPVMAEIVRVGLPQSLTHFLTSISFVFYNRVMIGIDPLIMSAFTLYSRLEQLALIPIWSLTSALAAVAGQAAGAGNIQRIRRASYVSSWMGLAVSGSLLLGYALASPWLFRIFQSDARVLALAAILAPWMAATSFVTIPDFMVNTVMSAAGFSGRSLALTAVRIYGLNVPAAFVGAYVGGLWGQSFLAVLVGLFVSSVLALALSLAAQEFFFNGLDSGRLKVYIPDVEGQS